MKITLRFLLFQTFAGRLLIPGILILCSVVTSLFAHKEMQFSKLEEPHKSWHLELFNRVMKATANLEEKQQTNFFAVKIVIVFKNGKQQIIDIESPYSSSNQSVDGIHELIFNGFICGQKNLIYLKNLWKDNDEQIKTLKQKLGPKKLVSFLRECLNNKSILATKLSQLDLAETNVRELREILQYLKNIPNGTFFCNLANYCLEQKNPFRLGDSEMVFLHAIINDEIKVIDEKETGFTTFINENKENIDHIEIHGFTTRDMCPCCYQHMRNAIQRLQYTCQIPVLAYISSLVKLSEDTLKFVPYGLKKDTLAEDDHLTCIFFREDYDTNFTFENAKQLARTLNLLKRDDNSIEEVFSIVNMLDGVLIEMLEENGVQSYIQNTDFSKAQQISSEPHQQSIANQIRSQGFEICNVTGDGNCGAYALWQGLACNEQARAQAIQHLQQNQNAQNVLSFLDNLPADRYGNVSPNDNVWNAAQALRQLLPEGNPRREMATQGEMNRWITDNDLQTFADILNITIVLISGQNGNRIFMPNGENNPAQQQTLAGVLSFARENNAVILYHNFNHYQTVIKPENSQMEEAQE